MSYRKSYKPKGNYFFFLFLRNRTGEHYIKWNKWGGERQIPYGLTYKWNLINKTNKQAKYSQRHWNKEQTDSDRRGGGDG